MKNRTFHFPSVDTVLTGLVVAVIAVVGGLAILVHGAQSILA